jgi:hypothetical protein
MKLSVMKRNCLVVPVLTVFAFAVLIAVIWPASHHVFEGLAEDNGAGRRYEPAVVDVCVRLFRDKGFAFQDQERLSTMEQTDAIPEINRW